MDLRLRAAYERFLSDWRTRNGWDLLRPMEGADVTLPAQIRIPVDDSVTEFDQVVLVLTRVFVDSLDSAGLTRRLTEQVENEQSLAKLDRWLTQEGYTHRERDMPLLRGLQSIRSKGGAHRKGSEYERAIDRVVGDHRGRAAAIDLMEGLVVALDDLSAWEVGAG